MLKDNEVSEHIVQARDEAGCEQRRGNQRHSLYEHQEYPLIEDGRAAEYQDKTPPAHEERGERSCRTIGPGEAHIEDEVDLAADDESGDIRWQCRHVVRGEDSQHTDLYYC